jgi:hypothetical protein
MNPESESREEVLRRFERLCHAPPQRLARALADAATPDPAALEGWEFRAFAPGPPPLSWLLPKHRKGFYRLREAVTPTGLGGYVVPCHASSPREPWVDRLRGPGSWKTAWFLVRPAGPSRFAASLCLDYGRGGRAGRLRPERMVREYLLQPDRANDDLMISAVEARAGRQVRHLGYTVMVRDRRSLLGVR